jgi:hypothetical protein
MNRENQAGLLASQDSMGHPGGPLPELRIYLDTSLLETRNVGTPDQTVIPLLLQVLFDAQYVVPPSTPRSPLFSSLV